MDGERRVALDTDILACAEGVNDDARRERAVAAVGGLADGVLVVPAQVLGELAAVLLREARRPPAAERDAILAWSDAAEVAPTDSAAMADAMEPAATHGLPVRDGLIRAVDANARCRDLWSGDFQAGVAWRGCVVRNPVAPA